MLSREYRKSLRYLFEWTALAITAGVSGTLLVHSFRAALVFMHSLITASIIPEPLAAAAGAALVALTIYKLAPGSSGEGIPAYINSLKYDHGHLDFRDSLYKYLAALLTLGTFGSGGVTGPLGRVNAGIMSRISEVFVKSYDPDEVIRMGAICGMSAVCGTIFHAPIGAGIFAVEIIRKTELNYKDLFPAILASSTSVWICKSLSIPSFYQIEAVNEFMPHLAFFPIILTAVAGGFLGMGFNKTYGILSRLLKRDETRLRVWRCMGVSLTVSFCALLFYPDLMGTSSELISSLTGSPLSLQKNIAAGWPLYLTALFIIVFKGLGNLLTVGTGLSAGFTGPVVILGMAAGLAAADFFSFSFASPEYFALLAAGFASMMASTMNVPLAAAMLAVEMFGLNYSFPAALAAIIGFQINRHSTIYDYVPASFR